MAQTKKPASKKASAKTTPKKPVPKRNANTAEAVGKPVSPTSSKKIASKTKNLTFASPGDVDMDITPNGVLPPPRAQVFTSVYNLPLQVFEMMLNPWKLFLVGTEEDEKGRK